MQNEAYKLKINAMKLTNEAQTRHQAKSNTVKSQQWEYGEVYNDRRSKSRAKILVLDELERRSGKQLLKAEEILSGIISELSCEHGLDEAAIWSSHTKGRMQAMEASISSASKLISGMSRNFNSSTARILTAVSAVLAPQPDGDGCVSVSRRQFCEMLGINRNSKYVELGFENRKLFNEYLKLEEGPVAIGEEVSCCDFRHAVVTHIGLFNSITVSEVGTGVEKCYPNVEVARLFRSIKIGEKVSCRASPEGILMAIGADDSVVISLLPLGTEKTYPSIGAARMSRFEV